MNRILCLAFVATAVVVLSDTARGDIVVGSVDFYNGSPQPVLRYDDTNSTGPATALPVGNIDPGSLAGGTLPFGPTDVAIQPATGNIYISDLAGQLLRVDGRTGEGLPGPFGVEPPGLFRGYIPDGMGNMPFGQNLSFSSLSFGPSGLLYVVDSFDTTELGFYNTPMDDGLITPGVRVFDTASGFQVDALFDNLGAELPALSSTLSSVTFNGAGNLLLSDTSGSRIYLADLSSPGNEVVTELVGTFDIDDEAGPDEFHPSGMAYDIANDQFYVANLGGNNILRFDGDGSNPTLIYTIRPGDMPDVNQLYGEPSHNPTDIVLDSEGNLLISILGDSDPFGPGNVPGEGGIIRIDTAGNLLQTLVEGAAPLSGLAIAPDLLPGDYNGDGTVDGGDYQKWQNDFGQTVIAGIGADGNRNGVVDAADYTVWRDTLGATGLLPVNNSSAAKVPEPASAIANGLALAMIAALRRRVTKSRR